MRTVPCSAPVGMEVSAPLRHLCPFVEEVDDGTVTIRWSTRGGTFELHALAAYLAAWGTSTISHEEITDRILHDLHQALRVDVIEVVTTWTTAGMEVRCSTSPIPVDLK